MSFEHWHAHLPWRHRHDFLPCILELGLAPEIAFKGQDLDDLPSDHLEALARKLAQSGRRPTLHAPFFDLSLGAMDPLVRKVTQQRLTQTIHVADRLAAHLVVVHPGYDRWRYPNLAANWVAQAMDTLRPVISLASSYDCRLALENIYESTPETLVALADQLDSAWFGHCFDIGHWRLFGTTSQADWLAAIAPRLIHLHLHDNLGQSDDHLPVGEGNIDFSPLLAAVGSLQTQPSLTLEAHDPDELQRSLNNLLHLVKKESSHEP